MSLLGSNQNPDLRNTHLQVNEFCIWNLDYIPHIRPTPCIHLVSSQPPISLPNHSLLTHPTYYRLWCGAWERSFKQQWLWIVTTCQFSLLVVQKSSICRWRKQPWESGMLGGIHQLFKCFYLWGEVSTTKVSRSSSSHLPHSGLPFSSIPRCGISSYWWSLVYNLPAIQYITF